MIYLCTQSQGFSWFQFKKDHRSTQKDIFRVFYLPEVTVHETGKENQMLTLINTLFCHAKVGIGDMDYDDIKNSE